jgi:hypothetical protein
MTDQTLASKLLETMAAQDTEKRHAQNDDSALPQVSNPEVVAWLRGLAPLTDAQIYNSAWND